MRYFLLLFVLIIGINVSAQRRNTLKIIHANKLKSATFNGKKGQKLIGDVAFKHGKTLMYCDSAFSYKGKNTIDAYGNVHIIDKDSVDIYSNVLFYNGNTKLAKLRGNVLMKDKKMTLRTEKLNYYMKTKSAFYFDGGVIVDKENTLTSDIGNYFSKQKIFYFKKKVVLINLDYVMNSDTLIYSTNSETAFFRGPSTIVSDENSIYCEKGWYNTKTDISIFQKNTFLKNKTQELGADSLYYDRNIGFGRALKNVVLFDSVKNIIIKGQYAEYLEKGGSSFFTDSAIAIMINESKDSLYIHGDTLRLDFDTNKVAEYFYAYNKVKFYKEDIQGKCDSLVYSLSDSVLYLNGRPLIWSDNSQMSGKKIRALVKNGSVNRLYVDTNAFVIQHDTLEYYNQVSGRNVIAYFKNDAIDYVKVLGNAQTIYFVKEEDNSLVGVNLASSSNMRVLFNSKGISNIIYLSKPKASLNPIKKVSKRALFLRGFKYYDYWRPQNKNEIFYWEPEKVKETTKLQNK